ncbi:DUF6225 family protein [Streptomyces sp. NPDC059832]|uniref:DUF6225 family protein n=1 Tax=unclassified Streptomyces TaxID=2593676 RepID=UPI00365BE3A6
MPWRSMTCVYSRAGMSWTIRARCLPYAAWAALLVVQPGHGSAGETRGALMQPDATQRPIAVGLERINPATGSGVPTTTPLPRSTPPIRTAGEGQNLPDDAPIHISVAGDPGDFDGYRDFVVVDAHQVENWWPATSTAPKPTERRHSLFAG